MQGVYGNGGDLVEITEMINVLTKAAKTLQ